MLDDVSQSLISSKGSWLSWSLLSSISYWSPASNISMGGPVESWSAIDLQGDQGHVTKIWSCDYHFRCHVTNIFTTVEMDNIYKGKWFAIITFSSLFIVTSSLPYRTIKYNAIATVTVKAVFIVLFVQTSCYRWILFQLFKHCGIEQWNIII